MPKKAASSPTRTPHPVTRAELARRLDRGKATITRLAGTAWAAARLPRGRIDVTHPDFVADVRKRWGTNPATLLDAVVEQPVPAKPQPAQERPTVAMPEADSGPALPAELMGWTLTQLTDRFGSAQGLLDWVAARRAIADLARVESRNARDEGRLISKEGVRVFVLGGFAKLFLRLVSDTPKSLALKLHGAVSVEQRERVIGDTIASQLALAKSEIVAALGRCTTGDNPPAVSPPDPKRAQSDDLRAFVSRLREDLQTHASAIVESEWKTFARFGAGVPFDRSAFDRVLAARDDVSKESTRLVIAVLDGVLRDAALREHERRAQQNEEQADVSE